MFRSSQPINILPWVAVARMIHLNWSGTGVDTNEICLLLGIHSLFLHFSGSIRAADSPSISIDVDARELPRRLIHTTLDIPCKPGPMRLWYPKWIPGTHGPKGRVEDIGGLRIETSDGTAIPWKRDEIELYCFAIRVPDGATAVRVKLDTICEEASGIHSYGNASVGTINWNTCLAYPEGVPADDQPVKVRLRLPADWKFATALKSDEVADGAIPFRTVSLSTLIDSPLIAGRHLRTIKLNPDGSPPAIFLHPHLESPQALNLDQKVVEMYSRLVREAEALFGVTHYSEYHFLVVCSDEFGRFGVEHLSSSMNGTGERALVDDQYRKGWVAMLLPHEYAHSWCGKYRRPATMMTPDYHTPMKTKLLWVYEGLTTYFGEVLMVRCGLVTPDEYRTTLMRTVRNMSNTAGRQWRPLEDTAVASYLSRNPGKSWNACTSALRTTIRKECCCGTSAMPSSVRKQTEPSRWTISASGSSPRSRAGTPSPDTTTRMSFEI